MGLVAINSMLDDLGERIAKEQRQEEEKINDLIDRLEELIRRNRYPDVMDTEKAAEFLSISYSMMGRLGRTGIIPSQKAGSKRLFTKENLLRWANGED